MMPTVPEASIFPQVYEIQANIFVHTHLPQFSILTSFLLKRIPELVNQNTRIVI